MRSLENSESNSRHSFSEHRVTRPLRLQILFAQKEFEKLVSEGGRLTTQDIDFRYNQIFNALEPVSISADSIMAIGKGDALKLRFFCWVVLTHKLEQFDYGDHILYTGYCNCFRVDLDCHAPRLINFTLNDVEQIKKGC
jgi:hypothetical protein